MVGLSSRLQVVRLASLVKRTFILVVCRIMNFGVVMLSPIFLVRIFDLTAYGQYREFVLYYFLLSGILIFSIHTNPIYFISKYPDKEKQAITHTALLLFIVSILGCVGIYLGKNLILSKTSYDFILPLILYVFFYVNMEFYESYCLGKKRTDQVLYFSATRAIIRLAAILVVAYITRDVMAVIWTIVAVEAVKCLFVLVATRKLLVLRLDIPFLKEQLRYIIPLGSSTAITRVNTDLAKLVVSSTLGANVLAIYSIGNYQVPIIQVVRSSIMDVLFPEMTQASKTDRIALWKKSTVALCFLVFPVFVVFFWFAKTVIVTLFTVNYLAAVPIFRIYLTLMLLQCFDMASPLRAMSKNKYFVIGNIIHLAVNLLLIFALFRIMGIMAPPLAFMTGVLVFTLFLGKKVLDTYKLGLRELVLWRKVLLIIFSCLITMPILFVARFTNLQPVIEAVLYSSAYLVVYLLIVLRFKLEEIDTVLNKFMNRMRRSH